ncbi:MAG: SIMPL domain-containing protein [Nocardioides sp.]
MRILTVTGHGTAQVEPDAADVRVAAVQRSTSVTDAVAGVDAAVRLAGATAREFTEAAQISSAGLSVWPHHDQQGRPAGFEARHSLAIRCPDLAAAGGLVSALAERVGDRLVVESVSLVVSDPQAAQDRAREAAFEDAHRRGARLAGLAEDRLGQIQSVVEGGVAAVHAESAGSVAYRSSLDVSFEGGLQAITTTLTVTFALDA